MAGELIYAFRVMRLPLLDAGGAAIGRIQDIVAVPGSAGRLPRVVGFVAEVQRRRIFVNANRLSTLEGDGARLNSWDVDFHPFKPHSGEVLVSAILDRKIGDESVSDVALRDVELPSGPAWEIAKVRLVRRNVLRRRPSYRLVDVDEIPALFPAPSEADAEAARLRDLHPAEVATIVRAMPLARRRQLAAAMDDERLADVLEELPEDEQLRLVEALDLDRLIGVLEEMEYDDLVDLLGEMPGEQRDQDPRGDGRRGRRRGASAAELRSGNGRRNDDAGADHPRTDGDRRRRAGPDPSAGLGRQHRRAGVRLSAAVQGADRQADRHGPLPAPAARAAEPRAAPLREPRPGRRLPTPPTVRLPNCSPVMTCSPSPCATPPASCSAR